MLINALRVVDFVVFAYNIGYFENKFFSKKTLSAKQYIYIYENKELKLIRMI